MKIRKLFNRNKFFLFSSGLCILFLLLISINYYRHATTFNFVDEYTNIIVAYFMDYERYIYKDIFFHHQFLIAYLSYALQHITNPETMYKLIAEHRLFVIVFSFIMDILLIYRFRYLGIGFVVFFEPLKYYLFGNLFLAESLIVYPLVYLLGLVWESLSNKKITYVALLLSALSTWFVVFMREPYIPLALIMFAILLWKSKSGKKITFSVLLFFILTLVLLLTVPLKDYIFQVITVNANYVIPHEVNGTGKFLSLLISFIYPFTIFFDQSPWNYYRVILAGLDILFLSSLGYLFYKGFNKYKILFLLIILMLANIRWVNPGTNFYIAYHAIVWFGMFCFSLFVLINEIYKINKKVVKFSLYGISALFIVMLIYPKSYFWEPINRQELFTINYGKYYTSGQIVNILSKPSDTLFIDYWDTLIYWQAKRDSSFKYAMYYPVTSSVPILNEERLMMFKNNPPDFYYTDCGKQTQTNLLPDSVKNLYIQLYFAKKPTCLYMKKTKIDTLSSSQLEQLHALQYYLPKEYEK